jgi:hypothetical protein
MRYGGHCEMRKICLSNMVFCFELDVNRRFLHVLRLKIRDDHFAVCVLDRFSQGDSRSDRAFDYGNTCLTRFTIG